MTYVCFRRKHHVFRSIDVYPFSTHHKSHSLHLPFSRLETSLWTVSPFCPLSFLYPSCWLHHISSLLFPYFRSSLFNHPFPLFVSPVPLCTYRVGVPFVNSNWPVEWRREIDILLPVPPTPLPNLLKISQILRRKSKSKAKLVNKF